MKLTPLLLIISSIMCWVVPTYAQDRKHVNYDESKVAPYTLPEILKSNKGKAITTYKEWEKIRRPEILKMFSNEMYGVTPTEKIKTRYEIISEDSNALNNKAIKRQVRFIFTGNNHKVEAILLLYIPYSHHPIDIHRNLFDFSHLYKKVPVLIGYNFAGNHSTTTDSTICYPPLLSQIKVPSDIAWTRGYQSSRWSFEKIIDRGYAVATMCYHDIYPDKDGLQDKSIAALFSDYGKQPEPSNQWGAIGAWAWGSSRIADYLETLPQIDSKKMAIVGLSRLGKAALWAGAQDKRFKIVISTCSGEGGAALSKRNFGETIQLVSSIKPAWFCPAYNKYRNAISEMPFDQHMLLSLIAPRKLYVSSAEDDLWADPKGEYISAYEAGKVYALYRLKGLQSATMPLIHHPIMESVGYHIRAGKHESLPYDMSCYLDFMDKWFK
jgi:hypothetical protein